MLLVIFAKMSKSKTALLNLLKEDHQIIAYRPGFAKHFGSVTAAILFQQILYRWTKNDCKPFYKFKDKCSHALYKETDSWMEELSFSRREFDGALKQIAQKISKGLDKDPDSLVYYWTRVDRLTYYEINNDALNRMIIQIYGDSGNNGTLRKVQNVHYVNDESVFTESAKRTLDINKENNKEDNKERESAPGFSEFSLQLDEAPDKPAHEIVTILESLSYQVKEKFKIEKKLNDSTLKTEFKKFAEWRTNTLVAQGKEYDLYCLIQQWRTRPRGAQAAFAQSWLANYKQKPQQENKKVKWLN